MPRSHDGEIQYWRERAEKAERELRTRDAVENKVRRDYDLSPDVGMGFLAQCLKAERKRTERYKEALFELSDCVERFWSNVIACKPARNQAKKLLKEDE